ncbi:HSP90 family protein [Epidermidibacterium keratini]|uniref:HSP90 family protein n=1 Tax=Epidermidibacterium keratini TaxID=1891644 RepID=A0A7L4YMZ1_9ACTN|nr:HSP90 family protein [Epidermidibacterium keratini]QHC00520.1 HSP90 family protein [Epidermidibacterium keratini]
MREQFQVNLRGIVDILSHHLYSSPRVYLRELIQNGRDAITARRQLEPDAVGSITIEPGPGEHSLVVADDGIGLTADEMRSLLATIGASSKRQDFTAARNDFLGQFGIGLLSCFLIADEIEVISRSAREPDAPTLRWVGYADGTFTVTDSERRLELPGTEVIIHPRREDREWTAIERVRRLASEFARYLDVPITVTGELVSQQTPPWELPYDEQLDFCQQTFGFLPIDAFEIRVDVLGIRGVAFVTDTKGRAGERAGDIVYTRGMLLSTRNGQLVPDWANFVRVVASAGDLSPTASRESLQENDLLTDAREAIGHEVQRGIELMAADAPEQFEHFQAVHATGLSAMAVTDPQMLDFVSRYLNVESSAGWLPLDELLHTYPQVHFVRRTTQYQSLRELAKLQGYVLVNGGYVYQSEILQQVAARNPRLSITELDLASFAAALPRPEPDDAALVRRLSEVWSSALAHLDLQLDPRTFAPSTIPALLLPSTTAQADDDLDDLLGDLIAEPEHTPPRIVLNLASPPVRALAGDIDDTVAREGMRAIYTLALLMRGEPLTEHESATLSQALRTLITAAAGHPADRAVTED